MSLRNYSEEYVWDNEPIFLKASSRINHMPLEEVWKSTKMLFSPEREGYVKVVPRNIFGRIKVEEEEGTRVYRVIPRKLFAKDVSKEEAYSFIVEKVLPEISEFLGFVLQRWEELRGYEAFKVLEKFFIYVAEFYAYMAIYFSNVIDSILRKLLAFGAIHKEFLETPSFSGGRMRSGYYPVGNLKVMSRRNWRFDTSLNIMVFQTVFYTMVLAAKVMRALSSLKGKRVRRIVEDLERTVRKCSLMLERYNLWPFYEEKPLPFPELLRQLITVQNPYYRMLFPYYSQLVYALFLRRGPAIEEVGEYPIVPFTRIYEVWAISKFLKTLLEQGYELLESPAKTGEGYLKFELSKGRLNIRVLWEPHFKPVIENSLYIGSVVEKAKELSGKLYSRLLKKRIKPDILLTINEGNILKKIYIGEVKFSKARIAGFGLPRLKDLYKVLGYLLDLKDAKRFSGSQIEGLLIYPGDIQGRVPVRHTEGVIYLNIVSLSYATPNPDLTHLFR